MITQSRAEIETLSLPGDIRLFPVGGDDGWESRVVGIGQLLIGCGHGHKQYSHAAVQALQPGFQCEAKWPRVGRYEIDWSRDCEIWRIDGITEGQRKMVLAWFAKHEGDRYGLVSLLTGGLINLPGEEVCSQAVGLSYAYAGIVEPKEGFHIWTPDVIPDWPNARMLGEYIAPKEGS